MAAIIPCDKCIHGKVCAMGFQFRRETANVTIVCKDIVRKTDVAPRAEVAREIFEELDKVYDECIDVNPFTNIGSLQVIKFEQMLAELKNKYAEGQK